MTCVHDHRQMDNKMIETVNIASKGTETYNGNSSVREELKEPKCAVNPIDIACFLAEHKVPCRCGIDYITVPHLA